MTGTRAVPPRHETYKTLHAPLYVHIQSHDSPQTGPREDSSAVEASIITPCRPAHVPPPNLGAVLETATALDQTELILIIGENPPLQRNVGIQHADSDTLLFVDEDVTPAPNYAAALHETLNSGAVVVAGGATTGCTRTFWCHMFSSIYRSRFALGTATARYDPQGDPRAAGQKELILSAMGADRETLHEHGGFDTALFPNEENALIDRLETEGITARYDPAIRTYRCPREPLSAFVSRFHRYGRGRAHNVLRTGNIAPEYLVPSLFFLYITLLPPALFMGTNLIAGIPAALYGILALTESSLLARHDRSTAPLLAAPLHPVIHLSYGLGFLHGLLQGPPDTDGPTVTHRIHIHPDGATLTTHVTANQRTVTLNGDGVHRGGV